VVEAGRVTEKAFTPALGRFAPVRFYDAVAALMRERVWRGLVVSQVAPRPDDVIVDVGCGTGTLARLLHQAQPASRIIGVDPDPDVLAFARRKAELEWRVGMGDELTEIVGPGTASAVVSSLVLHQCAMPVKRAILASMFSVLRPGGRLVIADYGWQRTRLMRLAFRVVQLADGVANTQPNASGVLPGLITEAGFVEVREVAVVPTISGSISVYAAARAAQPSA
jgi:ubiquinone/menaquinone biosynthesis C-methylase UbiE